MEVSPENYAQHAVRTERITTAPEVIPFETGLPLLVGLKAASELGAQLDRLKRAIFYGQVQDMKDILSKLPHCPVKGTLGGVVITPEQKRLLHSAIGLMTEAIEFAETVTEHIFEKRPLDLAHTKEEIGDIFWYSAIPVNLFGWTYADIMSVNIAKLRARYPDKWTQDQALNRDLDAERRVLEDGVSPQQKAE